MFLTPDDLFLIFFYQHRHNFLKAFYSRKTIYIYTEKCFVCMGKCNKTSTVYGEQISDLEEL